MSMRIASWKGLAAVAALSSVVAGCGGGGAADSSTETAQSPAATSEPTTTPAATPQMKVNIVQNGATLPAGETVAIFLDSLRRGNEQAANAVLTLKAREELAKSMFVLQPPGAPEGRFSIGRVTFEEGVTDVALVESTWTDPPTADSPTPVNNEIVCEVRKEDGAWRISGIALEIEGLETPLVLDFEDSAALNAAIAGAGVEPTGNPQAGATPPAGTQLPPTGTQEQGGVQIALPQFPNQPVNR